MINLLFSLIVAIHGVDESTRRVSTEITARDKGNRSSIVVDPHCSHCLGYDLTLPHCFDVKSMLGFVNSFD
jgi:hypothetical protein